MTDVHIGALENLEVTVLQNVNWKADRGDYWAVAGMHGTGKSNFIALTGGLMPPQSGTYRFMGREMPIFQEELMSERLRVGMVFSGDRLFHRLKVGDNIALPLLYHQRADSKNAETRLRELLELTELTPWADNLPDQLGRNWQRRVSLARALALEPELLLLDNPLAGLDLRHANWWLTFLGKLAAGDPFFGGRKMTLVVTVEDLRPWRNRATHFAVLEHHSLLVLGKREVLAGNAQPLVKELLAEESVSI
jgi:ABC-type transporter Mla maintaining outer membrane lipid asymmetry ATPase subunit MlaF